MKTNPSYSNLVAQWQLPSPIQQVSLPSSLWGALTHLWIKRDDLIHPIISGNKARKLLHELPRVEESAACGVMSMGGNYSNFLHALAYAAQQLECKAVGIIRGPEPKAWGATLKDLKAFNMECRFVNREAFKQMRTQADYAAELASKENLLWIPEGGSTEAAIEGVIESVGELSIEPDYIFVALGTGTTALGIAQGVRLRSWNTQVIAVAPLKGAQQIEESIAAKASQCGFSVPSNLTIEHRFCGKGFGRIEPDLIERMSHYQTCLGIPLEPVYAVKTLDALSFYGINQLIPNRAEVLYWHTGGIQGARSINSG
ncbi:1-aminocyclopropane-1-carboxylate deaminase/D-cysteine desulfhydrase [Pleionea sp. CnH1-48]|uniref:1-aminocyclopropane-1-carboxylate deaminase/D-cysteine desulfhydrase n=1 Tax=Pleionea sp. CnH1-48 TaxID=2954494 RepID=UPI002097022F|nr:pyridoxal-phosphate dependent enzyme [Pleionea sp. CnH1-48]MCO7226758.1 pyridoxal-phosphate dependent enzyme [Pleionea sp. CnH1-48]